MSRSDRSQTPRFDRPIYFDRSVIWADYVAVAVFALIAFGLALNFVGSDAPAREAAYKSRVAKLAEACGPPREASAAPTEQAGDGSPSNTVGPDATKSDAAKSGAVASDATGSEETLSDGSPAVPANDAAPSATDAPAEAPSIAAEAKRLPDRLCADEQMRIDAEAVTARAPTLHDLGMQIGEAGLLLALPLWVGLRVVDYRTGGPMRRLARSPYWRATRDARREQRQRRQSRRSSGSGKDRDDQPYESS